MSGTTVRKCSCTSEFQDEAYGKGNRLANLSEDGKSSVCTVCKGKHSGSTSKK